MYNYATILYNSEVNETMKGTGVDISRKEEIEYFKKAADNEKKQFFNNEAKMIKRLS